MIFTTCKKTEVRLVRGASHTLQIRVNGPDGGPYSLLEGDVIRFGVKYGENAGSYLIKKEIYDLEDGIAQILLEPEDTIDLETGEYKYDIGLQSGSCYFPVVKYSDFIVEPNVTWKE